MCDAHTLGTLVVFVELSAGKGDAFVDKFLPFRSCQVVSAGGVWPTRNHFADEATGNVGEHRFHVTEKLVRFSPGVVGRSVFVHTAILPLPVPVVIISKSKSRWSTVRFVLVSRIFGHIEVGQLTRIDDFPCRNALTLLNL